MKTIYLISRLSNSSLDSLRGPKEWEVIGFTADKYVAASYLRATKGSYWVRPINEITEPEQDQ